MEMPSSMLEPDEFFQLNRRDNPFVHEDRECPLSFEGLVTGNSIRLDRGFQHIHSHVGQPGSNLEGGFGIVTAVGVGPQEAIRSILAHGAGQLEIEFGIGRDLDVEIPVTALLPVRS